jgi:hypothetical protein
MTSAEKAQVAVLRNQFAEQVTRAETAEARLAEAEALLREARFSVQSTLFASLCSRIDAFLDRT